MPAAALLRLYCCFTAVLLDYRADRFELLVAGLHNGMPGLQAPLRRSIPAPSLVSHDLTHAPRLRLDGRV